MQPRARYVVTVFQTLRGDPSLGHKINLLELILPNVERINFILQLLFSCIWTGTRFLTIDHSKTNLKSVVLNDK